MVKTSGTSHSANYNHSKIIGIQFSILSPDEIRKGSVAEITNRDTYVNNKPVIGGLFDPRMGVLEPGLICPTDGLDYINTPGYFGHIELARPVFYIQYLNTIMKIIRCICFKCSKLLIDKEKYKHLLELSPELRWNQVFAVASKCKCCGDTNENGCGYIQPTKVSKEGFASLNAEWDNKKDEPKTIVNLTPEIVIRLFRRISNEDVFFLGFHPQWSRPEWMVCQVLAVPPPSVRPSVKHDAQQRSEDDITHIIVNIIKTNKVLQERIQQNVAPNIIEDWTLLLQYYVATQVDNKIPGASPVAQRSGRPLKSIKERLNGKQGRVRGNLMGKRVDFSARSVITADPNLSIRELGIPMKIAKNITKPVVVNQYNKKFLLKLIQNGPDNWPGAKILEKSNGENISLRHVDIKTVRLEKGDTVHRHMMDGDAILFNRQPTLHRMSMMCHIAKIMKRGDTFRMNVADTKPYNADFDGDEMNLHMPQDVESESELLNLAHVPYQIISPANNSSIIGIFQDSLLGCYQFTRENIEFDQRSAMNLLMNCKNVDIDILKGKKAVSSFEILSQILPSITLQYKTNLFKEKDDVKTSNNVLEIKNGRMIRGQIEKKVLGAGTKGILHRICNDYGNRACSDFVDNLQNVVTEYMKQSSYSVGISDLISNDETRDKISEIILEKKKDVKNLIDQIHLGVFENNSGKSNVDEFEIQVNNILNQATSEAGKAGRNNLNSSNRFVRMVNAGSKGSDLNISFMIACLGQQTINGKRIPYGFEDRTLPHFSKYDDSPGARGFVESSYIQGLTPEELFFHAMGGRTGLIDTAVKTSQTGYIQRRLIKGMEDLKVEYDMTVRNGKGKIVQFSYGDDGIDTIKVENQKISLPTMSYDEIYEHFHISLENTNTSVFLENVKRKLRKESKEMEQYTEKYVAMFLAARQDLVKHVFKNKSKYDINVPVALFHIINNIQHQSRLTGDSLVDITPMEMMDMVEKNYQILEQSLYTRPTELFKILYYYYLTPKEILYVKRFNRSTLEYLLQYINLMYKRSIVAPGEMVGMIAAQSIGEPTTQMTLNSVTYDTLITVRDDNKEIKKVEIGEFVEMAIKQANNVEYDESKDTSYAPLSSHFEVPCVSEDGEVLWKTIEAATQHPVVNEDGSTTLLKITTFEQRTVIATKAKSFLQLVDGKIQPVSGDSLKVGQYLPVSLMALDFNENKVLDLKRILPPSSYLYTSMIDIARTFMHEHHWWMNHHGKDFILPYKRSDTFYAKVNETNRETKQYFHPGCVYPKHTQSCCSRIPESLVMDETFGYVLGAYCAEGCMTKFQVSISNNDTKYFDKIIDFCEKYNMTYKIFRNEDKNQEGWVSQDIRIYSVILRDLLHQLCGKLSHKKKLHSDIVFSNKECMRGFLNAYISGYGTINLKDKSIHVSSTSKELLIDVQQMLNVLDIYSYIAKYKKPETNNRGTKSENIHQSYDLIIRNRQVQHFIKTITLNDSSKQEKLDQLRNHEYRYEISMKHEILPNLVDGKIVESKRTPDTMDDILFDRIISIEEVENPTDYVYDLTVADTRNFNIYNGLAMRDTFHFAGVASKSNVTRGVPRIEEILSLSENPKNPSLTVYLNEYEQDNRIKAQSIMYMIEHTNLKELVETIEICFDPDALNTLISEDVVMIQKYKEFEEMIDECAEELEEPFVQSKWILRMKMDNVMMLEKNITMDDVHFALKNIYQDEISCVYSDFNNKDLIFRIRMNNYLKKDKKKDNVKMPLDQSDEIYVLKQFQETLLNNVVLRGVKNIDKVIMRKVQDEIYEKDGVYEAKEIWVLDTVGTNLIDVLALDYIDNTRTFSNNIIETYAVLGIEAARQAIYNELAEVIEFDGTYINYHHLSLLCDRMSYNTKMVSIFRHGINNDNIGPIAKASFEETPEMFLKAARHGEMDIMRGVSANIMCGQEGYFGTSSFQVVVDLEMLKDLQEEKLEQEIELENALMMDSGEQKCSSSELQMTNNVQNIKYTQNIDDGYIPDF